MFAFQEQVVGQFESLDMKEIDLLYFHSITYLEGGEHRGSPLRLIFSSLEFVKCTWTVVLKYWIPPCMKEQYLPIPCPLPHRRRPQLSFGEGRSVSSRSCAAVSCRAGVGFRVPEKSVYSPS